jgi:hypothetical protein
MTSELMNCTAILKDEEDGNRDESILQIETGAITAFDTVRSRESESQDMSLDGERFWPNSRQDHLDLRCFEPLG